MALALRNDFDAARLRILRGRARTPIRSAVCWRRAAIYDGASRAEAAQIGGVTRQIVRDWVARFNESGPDGLVTRKAPGKPPLLDPGQRAALVGVEADAGLFGRAALAQVIEDDPLPAIDGVVRWRLVDLVQWVWEKFAISISRQTLGRELHAMGYRKLSARPRHHAQAAGAVEAFKKASQPQWRRSPGYRASIPAT